MRDIVVFGIVFGVLPFALFRPYYGLLLFTWLAYMRAPDLCWGPARSFRFSMIVGAVMFVGWMMFDKRKFMRQDLRNYLMIALALTVTASYVIAPLHTPTMTSKLIEFVKVMAISVFTTSQLDSKNRIRTIMLVMCLSFAFYGVKGGIWGIILQDARIIRGPGGMLLDNNDFSLAMVMNIPFLYYLAFTETNKRFKLFLRSAVFLTVITVVLTGSRGGFLAMATVAFALVMKSKFKAYAIPGAFCCLLLFIAFIPDHYRERLMTLKTAAKKDASAVGRLKAWGVAMEMVKENPILGVGFQNFRAAYRRHDKEDQKSPIRVAHNSYLQIWSETGSFSLLFFMTALISTIFLMRKLQRVVRIRDGPPWIFYYAAIIEVALYGFLVGAMFLNRGHFDFMYQLMALAVALVPVGLIDMHNARFGRKGRRGPARLVIRRGDPWLAR